MQSTKDEKRTRFRQNINIDMFVKDMANNIADPRSIHQKRCDKVSNSNWKTNLVCDWWQRPVMISKKYSVMFPLCFWLAMILLAMIAYHLTTSRT
jgi:hypothetical protein